MAISLVTNTKATTFGSGSFSTITSPAVDTTGANLLVMAVSYYGPATGGTVSDSKGNTWLALTEQRSSHTGSNTVRLYYCLNPTVGSGHTFTVNFPGGGGGTPSFCMEAFSGVNGGFESQNGFNSTSNSATTTQPGSVTPIQDGSLIVTGLSSTATPAPTINSSFTVTDTFTDSWYNAAMAYRILTPASSQNPTWTHGASNNGQAAAIAVFLPTAVSNSGMFFRFFRKAWRLFGKKKKQIQIFRPQPVLA